LVQTYYIDDDEPQFFWST